MPSYKINQKCYYGETGKKPQLYYPGDVYTSATLAPEKAPKYFQLVTGKAAPVAIIPNNKVALNPEGTPAAVEMSYHEMKSFVMDNNIEVADHKKETLIKAIKEFKDAPAPVVEDNTEETDPELPE